MKKCPGGSVLLVAVFFVVLAVPILLVLGQTLRSQLQLAREERQILTAQDLPKNVLTDYMRQFAQNLSLDWSDSDQFVRPDVFYASGFSTSTVVVDPNLRRLSIKATGTYDPLGRGEGRSRSLRAVIGFSSDILRYAKNSLSMNISDNNRTFGPLYSSDFINVTGLNVVVNGNVAAKGNVNLHASTTVNGNLYHGGLYNGLGTVTGLVFNYAHDIAFPPMDIAFWLSRCRDNAWANPVATYTFRNNGTVQIDDGFGSRNVSLNVPGGIVLVTEGRAHINGNNDPASADGKVSGRVTLVASTVTIRNSLVFASGNTQSSANEAMAIISFFHLQLIKDDNTRDTMRVTASLWTSGMASPTQCNPINIVGGAAGIVVRWMNLGPGGAPAARLTIIGASSTGVNRLCDNWNGNAHPHIGMAAWAFNGNLPIDEFFDPTMSAFPPPGFPERAMILDYQESVN